MFMEHNSQVNRTLSRILSMPHPECRRVLKLFVQMVPLNEGSMHELESTLALRGDLYQVLSDFRKCAREVEAKASFFERNGEHAKAGDLFTALNDFRRAASAYRKAGIEPPEMQSEEQIVRDVLKYAGLENSHAFKPAPGLADVAP